MTSYSRPSTTGELIERLTSTNCTAQETRALTTLCRSMITSFRNGPKLSYVAEAAAISKVLKNNMDDMDDLIIAFSNAIISGTSDASIKENEILDAFAFVLRHTKELPYTRSRLGPVLQSLTTRLKTAKVQADTDAQYHLVVCLSRVLDAMADIKFSGISRESLHEPLVQELQALSRELEPRLAQAAAYAVQAIRGVSDDEGPWQAIWRYTNQGISVIANTAGAVAKADPSQLYATIPDVVSLVEGLQSLFENATEVAEAIFADKDWIDSMNKFKKPKMWYRALRYLDLFLQCKAWEKFKEIVIRIDCREEEHFLSGVYSLLESAWIEADQTEDLLHKENIVTLLKWTLATTKSVDSLVQAWASLATNTVGCSNIIIPPKPSGFKRWTAKKYESKLHLFHQHTITSNPTAGKLLTEAWQDCIEAKIYYANAAIRQYYIQGNRLDIERLSGERLPLDKCFINLTLTRDSVTEKEDHSRPYLKQDKNIYANVDNNRISLLQLFDPRNSPKGDSVQPRRVFIQGRAGIGKTTLCKKIVHEFLQERLGRDLFDHILWIPLRRLKNKTEKYTLSDLLLDEYFSHIPEGQVLAETINRFMHDATSSRKVLCLLDGLDEVSRKWDRDTSPYELLQKLLMMPSVIITSRPQVASFDLGIFDLELETIGFQPIEVENYMKHCISDKSKLTKVKQYLEARPLLQDIARIPIQLDALCYIWAVNDTSQAELNTVTKIYQLITEQLWKKDIVRTNKQHEGLRLTQRQAQNLKGFQITKYMKVEEELLEEFAFQGFQAQVIEFTPQHCDAIASELYRRKVPIPMLYLDTLGKLSFLRGSVTASAADAQSYHFLHLTFQEFFAAKHFARHWVQGKDVSSLDLNTSRTSTLESQMSLVELIHKQKYNSRYMVFWQFVAGLIQVASDYIEHSQRLIDFYNEIEGEPSDLLGVVHHRLLTNLLGELSPSNLPVVVSLRSRIEDKLCSWAVQQLRTSRYHSIAEQPEFSDRILAVLTKDVDYMVRDSVLGILLRRTYLAPSAIALIAENAPKDLTRHQNKVISALIARQYKVSKTSLYTLLEEVTDIQHYSSDARSHSIGGLAAQMNLFESTGATLVEFLNDTNGDDVVRIWAAKILQAHNKLPESSIATVLDLFKNGHPLVYREATIILAQQPSVSLDALEVVLKWLENVYRKGPAGIIIAIDKVGILFDRLDLFPTIVTLLCSFKPSLQSLVASRLLEYCELVPQNTWDLLLAFTRDTKSDLRMIACTIIGHRADAPLAAFSALIALLSDKNSLVSDSAAKSLRVSVAQLPQQTFASLTELLTDTRPQVRKAALSALPERCNLTLNTLNLLHMCLKSPDREECMLALDVLSNEHRLPRDILYTFSEMLGYEEPSIRKMLLKCLQNQITPSNILVRALIKEWTNGDKNVVVVMLDDIIKAQRDLPRDIFDFLLLLLKTGSELVQQKACEILMLQPELSLEIKNELSLCLKSTDFETRAWSTIVLGSQPCQSHELIRSLVELVNEGDYWIGNAAGSSLAKHSDLPEEFLIQVTGLLQDDNVSKRLIAHRLLSTVKNLSAKVINVLVEISNTLGPEPGTGSSKHERRNSPRILIIEILSDQLALSDVAIEYLSTLIDHKNYKVRTLALEKLATQSSLPLSVAQFISDFLNQASFRKCRDIVDTFLWRHSDLLYDMLPELNDRVVATICFYCFNSAACYVHNGLLWIRTAEKCREVSIHPDRLKTMVKIIQGTKNRQLTLAIAQEMSVPEFLPLEGYDDHLKTLEGEFLGHSWDALRLSQEKNSRDSSFGYNNKSAVVDST